MFVDNCFFRDRPSFGLGAAIKQVTIVKTAKRRNQTLAWKSKELKRSEEEAEADRGIRMKIWKFAEKNRRRRRKNQIKRRTVEIKPKEREREKI